MTREEVLKIIHETIYQYFDVCADEEETPISDKDKLLLEINKSICNKIKENWETEADLITRQGALDAIDRVTESHNSVDAMKICAEARLELLTLPSAQPEPLTDKEQRIFLAAMGREEKVCEEVDKNYVRESHEDSLMPVCKEIIRKVKGALWT